MNFLDWILYKIRGRKNAFPKSKHVIRYAFTSGGIEYFTMDDIFNIPWQRGTEAAHVYEELRMKCDLEYLREHTKLVNEIVTGNKFGLDELQKLRRVNDQLRQRLNWIVIPDHAYKLASIVFFDASENPTTYEIGYARKKIAHWKKHSDVESFFLQMPVHRLMPFLDAFEGNFQDYSELVEEANRHHLNNLSTKFSEKPESDITVKR